MFCLLRRPFLHFLSLNFLLETQLKISIKKEKSNWRRKNNNRHDHKTITLLLKCSEESCVRVRTEKIKTGFVINILYLYRYLMLLSYFNSSLHFYYIILLDFVFIRTTQYNKNRRRNKKENNNKQTVNEMKLSGLNSCCFALYSTRMISSETNWRGDENSTNIVKCWFVFIPK